MIDLVIVPLERASPSVVVLLAAVTLPSVANVLAFENPVPMVVHEKVWEDIVVVTPSGFVADDEPDEKLYFTSPVVPPAL